PYTTLFRSRVGVSRRQTDRLLGARRIPQITFKIGDLGGLGLIPLDILRPQLHASAEIGVHGALAVGRDEDHRARRGRRAVERDGVEGNPLGADVVGIDLSQMITGNLAEKGSPASKTGNTG